jgi:hypothetical protein
VDDELPRRPTVVVLTTEHGPFPLPLLVRDGASARDSPGEQRDGLDSAYRLQHELGPDVDVRYAHDGDADDHLPLRVGSRAW